MAGILELPWSVALQFVLDACLGLENKSISWMFCADHRGLCFEPLWWELWSKKHSQKEPTARCLSKNLTLIDCQCAWIRWILHKSRKARIDCFPDSYFLRGNCHVVSINSLKFPPGEVTVDSNSSYFHLEIALRGYGFWPCQNCWLLVIHLREQSVFSPPPLMEPIFGTLGNRGWILGSMIYVTRGQIICFSAQLCSHLLVMWGLFLQFNVVTNCGQPRIHGQVSTNRDFYS